MEIGESLEDGAKREAYEEARLVYEIIKLYGSFSIPRIGQVLFVYLAKILNKKKWTSNVLTSFITANEWNL